MCICKHPAYKLLTYFYKEVMGEETIIHKWKTVLIKVKIHSLNGSFRLQGIGVMEANGGLQLILSLKLCITNSLHIKIMAKNLESYRQILKSTIIYKQGGSITACYSKTQKQTVDHMAFFWVICICHKTGVYERLHIYDESKI